jgi:hypothetical protein
MTESYPQKPVCRLTVVRRLLSFATSQDHDLAHGLFFADGEADLASQPT